MSKRFPQQIYVRVENEGLGRDEFLILDEKLEDFAEPGRTVTAACYQLVDTIKVSADVRVSAVVRKSKK